MNDVILGGGSQAVLRSDTSCPDPINRAATLYNLVVNSPASSEIKVKANDLKSCPKTSILDLLRRALEKLEEELKNIQDIIKSLGNEIKTNKLLF